MAWRALGRKGISVSLTKALAATSRYSVASVSKCEIQTSARTLSVSMRHLHGCCNTAVLATYKDNTFSEERCLIRCFHASPELLDTKRESSGRVETIDNGKLSKGKKESKAPVEAPSVPPKFWPPKTIEIFEGMSVLELADRCGESTVAIQKIIADVGDKVDSEFDTLDIDIAELVAMEVGFNVRRLHKGVKILPRPPVVAVLGHGWYSVMNALRATSLPVKEARGINLNPGAFVVCMQSGAPIIILANPMQQAVGGAVTDIVVLTVGANERNMALIYAVICHAKSAKVPIVVAITECDKPDAQPDKVKMYLASKGLLLEEMGGDVRVVEVSAVNKTWVDLLKEALLAQAESMNLKAPIDEPAQAYVVTGGLSATAIVMAGTLVCGQHIVTGADWGRIGCIRDTVGNSISQATPAIPVVIEGINWFDVMNGDNIVVVKSEERARMLSEGRKKKKEKDSVLRYEEYKRNTERFEKYRRENKVNLRESLVAMLDRLEEHYI